MISFMWISKPGTVIYTDRSQNSGYFGVAGLRWRDLNADWVGYKGGLRSIGNNLYLDLKSQGAANSTVHLRYVYFSTPQF